MAMTKMERTVSHKDSTPLLAGPAELRARAQEDGYLFFKGLLPPEGLWKLRRQILDAAQRHGFLNDRAPIDQGVARDGFFICESDDPKWKAYYCDVLKLHDFHAMALHPNLLGVLGMLFCEPVLPHSRNISMALFPRGVRTTTPAHQDFPFIGGSLQTWTAWIPCGDCPKELGGLALVPGTHKGGLLEQGTYDSSRTGIEVPPASTWATDGLKCGDVLMFNSLTIHQGVENTSADRIRLSLDFRYQPLSEPVSPDSMQPHLRWLTWEQVYRDWPEKDPVKYYWRDWKLNMA